MFDSMVPRRVLTCFPSPLCGHGSRRTCRYLDADGDVEDCQFQRRTLLRTEPDLHVRLSPRTARHGELGQFHLRHTGEPLLRGAGECGSAGRLRAAASDRSHSRDPRLGPAGQRSRHARTRRRTTPRRALRSANRGTTRQALKLSISRLLPVPAPIASSSCRLFRQPCRPPLPHRW